MDDVAMAELDVAPEESYPRQRARTRGFRLGAPRSVTVASSGERVFFLRSRSGTDPVNCLWSVDVETGAETCLVDPLTIGHDGELPPEERARRERMREVTGGITDYATDRETTVASFALAGRPYVADLAQGTVTALSAPGAVIDPRVDPTGHWVAYVADGALHVAPTDGGGHITLVSPESDTVTWGLADFIAAEELERIRGFWWLADGSGLLVERVDTAPVATWWIADPAHPDAAPQQHRYPAAGQANAEISLWLVATDPSVAPREVVWDSEAFPYLTTVDISQNAHPLVAVLSRDQRRQMLLEVDPMSAASTTIAERQDPDWIDVVPGSPTRDARGRLVEVLSDRESDTNRLFVDGAPVSPAGLQVFAVLDADDDILLSAGDDPVREGVYVVHPEDATATRWPLPGVAGARRRGGVVVSTSTDIDRTGSEMTLWKDGVAVGSIASLAEQPVIAPVVHLLTLGERALNAALLLPSGHVPGSRRLPIICSPYGGPHARRVLAAGLAYGTDQWLADQGFAVLVADGRGTPGRGPAWDRSVRGDLATPALDDQVAAVAAAVEMYPDDLDPNRVGIRGWSFGGYLAALAVLRRPDVFHAAVAGAPVTDWRLYDTGYTERYLGLPQDHDADYEASSLLPLASELTRPLLIIHGLADDNVVAAHTLHLSSALLAAGRPHAVLPLTGVTHMTPQEIVAENLLRAELDFFRQSLA